MQQMVESTSVSSTVMEENEVTLSNVEVTCCITSGISATNTKSVKKLTLDEYRRRKSTAVVNIQNATGNYFILCWCISSVVFFVGL